MQHNKGKKKEKVEEKLMGATLTDYRLQMMAKEVAFPESHYSGDGDVEHFHRG